MKTISTPIDKTIGNIVQKRSRRALKTYGKIVELSCDGQLYRSSGLGEHPCRSPTGCELLYRWCVTRTNDGYNNENVENRSVLFDDWRPFERNARLGNNSSDFCNVQNTRRRKLRERDTSAEGFSIRGRVERKRFTVAPCIVLRYNVSTGTPPYIESPLMCSQTQFLTAAEEPLARLLRIPNKPSSRPIHTRVVFSSFLSIRHAHRWLSVPLRPSCRHRPVYTQRIDLPTKRFNNKLALPYIRSLCIVVSRYWPLIITAYRRNFNIPRVLIFSRRAPLTRRRRKSIRSPRCFFVSFTLSRLAAKKFASRGTTPNYGSNYLYARNRFKGLPQRPRYN